MGWLDNFNKYRITPYDFSYTEPTKIPPSSNSLPLPFPKQQLITTVNKEDLTGFDKNQILWNGWINDDGSSGWSARDVNGNPLIDNEGKKRIWGLGDSGSGSISRGNGRYSHDSKAGDINKQSWYNFITSTYSDENKNPTTHGKNWLKQYVRFSGDDLPFKKQLQKYIDSGFTKWEPITRGGNTFYSFGDFAEDVYTKQFGQGHNTDRGILPYYIDENGNRKLFEKGKIDFLNYKQIPANEQLEGTNVDLVGYRPTSLLDKLDSETPISDTTPKDTSLEAVKSKVSEMNTGYPGGKKKVDETEGSSNGGSRGPFNPTILDAMRLAADNLFNIRNTNKYKEALRPALENYSESYRWVNGDYNAKQQAENAAASLRNRTPLTSNAQIQTASDLEAIARGNQYIQQGQAKDAQTYWKTSEQAFQQAKENTLGWQNTANRNYASLVNYKNKLAELDYMANKGNMDNIDKFIAEQSKRLWDKYDLYDYKRMQAEDNANDLYDKYYGNSGEDLIAQELTTKYTDLVDQIYKTTDPTEKQRLQNEQRALQQQMRMLSTKKEAQRYINYLRRYNPNNWNNTWNFVYGNRFTVDNNNIINGFKSEYAQKLREQGIDVDKLLNLFGWSNTSNQQESTSRESRNGMKLQSGGSFGVSYTSAAGGGNPYLQSLLGRGSTSSKKKADYSSSDSSSDKDDDSKQKDKLLNEIANTLKGIDGLNSDVDVLYQELSRFFDLQQYNLDDDPMQFYSMYIKALNRVNQVKQSAKQFDSAYKALEKSDSMTSPAIDSNGYVYVGVAGTNQIDRVSPIDYIQNRDKYQLLRNNEILELRRNSSAYAFDDRYMMEAAYNGTSMRDVNKFIKEVLGKIGTDQESKDMIVRQYGQNAIEGLQQLQDLAKNQFTTPETAAIIANLKGNLTELNLTTKTQEEQAKLGIKTIIAMMPANMRTMLMIQGGSVDSMERIVTGYVFSGIDTYSDFSFNKTTELDLEGNTKSSDKSSDKSSSKSSSGGDKESQKDQTLISIIRGMGGTSGRITINEGSNSEMSIDSTDYMIDGGYSNGKLSDVLKETKIMGISDSRKIYFGDQLLNSKYLSEVAYLGRGFSRVMLPVTQDGSPDFTILSRFKNVCDIARKQGIDPNKMMDEDTSDDAKRKFAELLQGEGLYGLTTSKGIPNMSKFKVFLLTDGLASSNSGIKDSKYVVQNDDESDLLEKIIEREVDRFTAYNPADWFSHEKIYEGTIYIPININELQADIASGNKIKDSDAQQEEAEAQSLTIKSRFKDRE